MSLQARSRLAALVFVVSCSAVSQQVAPDNALDSGQLGSPTYPHGLNTSNFQNPGSVDCETLEGVSGRYFRLFANRLPGQPRQVLVQCRDGVKLLGYCEGSMNVDTSNVEVVEKHYFGGYNGRPAGAVKTQDANGNQVVSARGADYVVSPGSPEVVQLSMICTNRS